jgi:dipeptidyl aminopeptidase/acylaminoacyl peptidase
MSAGPNGLLALELHTINVGLARTSATESGLNYLDSEKEFVATPDVAPDGSIVTTINRAGETGIWILPKSGKLRKLISLPEGDVTRDPRWSPDGSRIAFATVPGANAIRVITSSGANVAAISFHGIEIGTPAWTANGRAIVFPGRDNKGWQLWRFELAHPEKLQATPYSGWLTIRFRGAELYGVRYDAPGVWRIDGRPRRITRKPSSVWWVEWTIAGDDIVYVDDPFEKHRQLMAQPIAGGPARVLAQVPNYAAGNGFAIDPTDGTVVYTATLNSDSDIELLHLAYE